MAGNRPATEYINPNQGASIMAINAGIWIDHRKVGIVIISDSEKFQKQIKNKELQNRIVGVSTADKLTDRKIVAKVREYYFPTNVGS